MARASRPAIWLACWGAQPAQKQHPKHILAQGHCHGYFAAEVVVWKLVRSRKSSVVLRHRSLGVPQASTVQPQQVSASTGAAMGSIDALALAAALAGAAGGSGAGAAQQMQHAPGPSLAEVLTPEVLIPLVSEPGVLQRLAPHLPVRPPAFSLRSPHLHTPCVSLARACLLGH